MSETLMKPFTEFSIPGATKTLQEHRRILQVVSRTVPEALRSDIQFCRIENNVLRITAGNAATLARMRFSTSQIIDDLASDGITVTKISWHVSREDASPAVREPRGPLEKHHDSRSAELLKSTAGDMPDDELRAALLKVAKHLD